MTSVYYLCSAIMLGLFRFLYYFSKSCRVTTWFVVSCVYGLWGDILVRLGAYSIFGLKMAVNPLVNTLSGSLCRYLCFWFDFRCRGCSWGCSWRNLLVRSCCFADVLAWCWQVQNVVASMCFSSVFTRCRFRRSCWEWFLRGWFLDCYECNSHSSIEGMSLMCV